MKYFTQKKTGTDVKLLITMYLQLKFEHILTYKKAVKDN